MQEIDNFELLMSHMDFVDPNDRYIVHIMRRPKDCKALAKTLGASEAQRLIRTYYVDNIEYLHRKIPAIKELCNSCNARAYLIVQPKDNFECLLNLGRKILDTIQLKNYSVKPEHLLRQAYCENHHSRKKLWILDLDKDQMIERKIYNNFGGKILCCKEWTLESVMEMVKRLVEETGHRGDDVYTVPTKNGWHIVTPPFNISKANEECSMLYEGSRARPVKCERHFLKQGDEGYARSPGLDEKYDIEYEQQVGWLHKDGMTLLYCPYHKTK